MYAYLQSSSIKVHITEAWSFLGVLGEKYNLYASETTPIGLKQIRIQYSQANFIEHDGRAMSRSFYTLMHELQHAVDFAADMTNISFSAFPADATHRTLRAEGWNEHRKYFESRAVHAENELRQFYNETKLRLNYSGYDIYKF